MYIYLTLLSLSLLSHFAHFEFRSLICIWPLFTQGAGTKGQLGKQLALPKGSGLNMLSVGAAWAPVWSCSAEVFSVQHAKLRYYPMCLGGGEAS